MPEFEEIRSNTEAQKDARNYKPGDNRDRQSDEFNQKSQSQHPSRLRSRWKRSSQQARKMRAPDASEPTATSASTPSEEKGAIESMPSDEFEEERFDEKVEATLQREVPAPREAPTHRQATTQREVPQRRPAPQSYDRHHNHGRHPQHHQQRPHYESRSPQKPANISLLAKIKKFFIGLFGKPTQEQERRPFQHRRREDERYGRRRSRGGREGYNRDHRSGGQDRNRRFSGNRDRNRDFQNRQRSSDSDQ